MQLSPHTGNVGSGAAVRATGHAHDDGVVAQTILLAYLFHFVYEHRQVLAA